MPILNKLQLRSPRGRLLAAGMYVVLIIGAVWMVYPFLLMVSGSVKSEVDIRQFDIVPRFLRDDAVLFRKFEEQRYGGLLDKFSAVTRYRDSQGRPLYSFEFLSPPPPLAPTVVADWQQFLAGSSNWPKHFWYVGHLNAPNTVGEILLLYQHRIRQAFPDLSPLDLPATVAIEEWPDRNFFSMQGAFAEVYERMRHDLPARYFIVTSLEGHFIGSHLLPRYGSSVQGLKKLNEKWGTAYASIYDATLSPTPPSHPGQLEDWWDYVRGNMAPRFVKFPEGTPAGTELESLSSPGGLALDGPEFRWRDFLRVKYHDDLAALRAAHHADYASFDAVRMPLLQHDWQIMEENRSAIIRDYFTRNYRIVWGYLAGHGRALRNTLLFCALNVLTALIINPLAAYALSRFQPRWGYTVLFLLMATMAFPGEVTQIPAFLMLRELGLLNTFAALIIPAAANGYSIFLLKGFFDSLPKELYESATIDGASERCIFTTITLPLSTPILAVIALGSFTAAYGAFMFALLICQKESMWTLMVYIYELQQRFGTPVIFASLVLAAIPTLLVFICCQNVIMRGIVVPVEK